MGTLESIGISREGLGHILQDNVLFVPTYQRSYAWGKQHVTALLEDLAGAIQKKSAGKQGDYFLGSVVAIKRTSASNALEVVDGQQRLATTSIIITAIRDYLLRTGDEEGASQIEKSYLRWFDMRARNYPARLKLNEIDNDFYLESILSRPKERRKAAKPSKPSHKKIATAYRTISKYIAALASLHAKGNASAVLLDWIDFLRDRAQVIRVTVQDDADAFVIFETLNDRGLELSTADLLKNHLFGISGDRIEEAKDRWRAMLGALETVTAKDISVDYIRQYWGSKYGLIRKRELFYEIKQEITNPTKALALSTDLDENSKLYAAILNPAHELWSKYGTASRHALTTIRLLRMERLRPLLLSILAAFPVNEVKKSLLYLVSASVRLNLAGGSAGPVEVALGKAAMKVRSQEIKTTAHLAKELSIIPGDTVFERSFAVARVKNAQMARYYLRALEEALIAKEPTIYVLSDDEDDLSLEHIIPERGREKDWGHIPVEKADELCRRLGNMVLLDPSVNSQIKSSGFAHKVSLYSTSNNTRLTKLLAERYGKAGNWGEEQLDEWQTSLAKLAIKAWSLKPASK